MTWPQCAIQGSRDTLARLDEPLAPLAGHPMRSFFEGHVLLEMQCSDEAAETYMALLETFPVLERSPYLLAQIALARYNQRDFDEAQQLFERLREVDPHRMELMDTYSNILYVKEERAALSHLAHHAMRTDKYRAETCCIVGNYYSLKADHENAVLYFQRALKLDRECISAWTLMGHEYVELKNTSAAVAAYRRAVDISPRDYRAWYGLGQTYEFLQLFNYALYYYRRAATLRPYDPRMYVALGSCLELLNRTEEAIDAYKLAHRHGDREGIATLKLGNLYVAKGNGFEQQAAEFYLKHLTLLEETESVLGEGYAEAALYLAKHHRDTPDVAESFCRKLLDLPQGAEKDEGMALLREIRAAQ